ncbi:MAG TPA: alkaline phosphatase family protein, partial [Acidimicrobiia bacterium]|nr:alkaline phosphatase family protein [Acidimicrobiia bacterium]
MEPLRPAYDGAAVNNLVPALLGARPAAWLPDILREAPTVVLLVVDGVGWDAATSQPVERPEFAALEGRAITTVAPTTTASALTSITTGLPPSQHGVTGFRVLVDHAVLNVLSWQSSDRHPPDPFVVQRFPPFLGRTVPVVTKAEFKSTGFTEAHLRGTRFLGWKTMSGLVERCRLLATAGEPLVYAYYDGVDAVAHAHGLHDGFYEAELRAVDRLIGDLRDVLPDRAVLAVTSDHGQVHVGPEGWRTLAALGDQFERGAGDGRFRYLYAPRGAGRALLDAATDQYADEAWVFSREQLL